MMKIYKGHIVYTKERTRFEVVENGYIAVGDGRVQAWLPAWTVSVA